MKEFNKLIIKNLYKSYGDIKVLKDFNLIIEKGEFVTFLGPSGCGKSTALNCISGLIQVTDGEIYVDDECIDDSKKNCVPPEKRGFGMVFQNYALFPHLSVFKNVAFGLEIKKVDKKVIKERVENALKMVYLEGFPEKFPGQLSGGQQQRVAIARCIVMEPRLLLLDEPLSNLDAKLRIELRYELKTIHERLHISTIYVTHDQQEALALSDKIVVMKNGVIQQVGTPEEIHSKPANLFVADFMGIKNLWIGKIKQLKENSEGLELTIDVNGIQLISRYKGSDNHEANKRKLIEAYKNGKEIVTAIRPEDISLGDAAENRLKCKVSMVEYLGTTSQVSVKLDNGVILDARTSSKLKEGDAVIFSIAPEKILAFPKEEE